MKILMVAGARPNFMKVAPIIRKIEGKIPYKLVHTGQHYDALLSDVFFQDLGIPAPHYNLEVGSGSHASQTAHVMMAFEKVCEKEQPTHVLVVGDVNSTLAAALVAKKMGIQVIHVEAGLRSFDRSMPEEINRILVDSIADILFVTEESGVKNLHHEGISDDKIHFVGNVMIDTLISQLEKIEKIPPRYSDEYCVVTLHRPSNVDDKVKLQEILEFLVSLPLKVVFPIHPRTSQNIKSFGLQSYFSNLEVITPLGYREFISLLKNSRFVLTDSGGIQEESTYLKIPCVTLRTTTERPVTVEEGSNILVGDDVSQAKEVINSILSGNLKKSQIPKLWDGKSAERITEILLEKNGGTPLIF